MTRGRPVGIRRAIGPYLNRDRFRVVLCRGKGHRQATTFDTRADAEAFMNRFNSGMVDEREIQVRIRPEEMPEGRRNYKYKYGASYAELVALLIVQRQRCSVCYEPMSWDSKSGPGWVADHCHETGRLRGLIHRTCNTGLGLLGDDIRGIRSAYDYLNHSPGVVTESPSENCVIRTDPGNKND